MPEGTKIVSVTPSGASAWVHSVCIEACLPDGKNKLYFLKVNPPDTAAERFDDPVNQLYRPAVPNG